MIYTKTIRYQTKARDCLKLDYDASNIIRNDNCNNKTKERMSERSLPIKTSRFTCCNEQLRWQRHVTHLSPTLIRRLLNGR